MSELTFEQKVMRAALAHRKFGDPIKDFLDDNDQKKCILELADIYDAAGYELPKDEDDAS